MRCTVLDIVGALNQVAVRNAGVVAFALDAGGCFTPYSSSTLPAEDTKLKLFPGCVCASELNPAIILTRAPAAYQGPVDGIPEE